ncbi:hypothetical protein M406DRAFT_108884 [Cryphonectria parasitica EP155]|uniref:DUF6590 domain-containing protein n=1 Tax=Cryphonectria parasitica (strain ATCC 38755 / EP155) TaxID=660469 RepID=A0A9P5CLE1_CRYP1|nr:uncharacterized protein M406DRAFT_108884 [Cryphonectria parasitica EP155]KAF3761735.1 hypothetical protein M406DRAFT_108884 [Cryphonectria parasitica EP155]
MSLNHSARKGYEIGPASKLQIGDTKKERKEERSEKYLSSFGLIAQSLNGNGNVWATRGSSSCDIVTAFLITARVFHVLNDRTRPSSPHRPISVGNKRDFAKPGIDNLQQGYVYASGEKDRDRDGAGTDPQTNNHQQQRNLPQLPYSSVGLSLRSGRHRVKDDSRANYADIVEVDHEAQVMVIGDVARYFDRVRKNVNKAFMRQMLREALGPYCQRKKSESAAAGVRGWGNSAVALVKAPSTTDGDHGLEQAGGHQGEGEAEGSIVKHHQQQPLQLHDGEEQIPLETPMEKDMEDFFSDTTREEDDWDAGSVQSTAYSPRPSDDRRPHRGFSRSRTLDNVTAVRPGMDKAGLSSLRSLRQGLPGGDDHDDTLSLRSLAMVGRSDSFSSSRRSRK